MHRDVAATWSLQALAEVAGTSRSVFAERFSRIVGVPPMQYLTRWRMQIAAHRLLDTTAKLIVVADEVGYDSEEAFSRAFKRIVGVSPSRWRRIHDQSDAVLND
jgi:AraC-like DNA-binding protein